MNSNLNHVLANDCSDPDCEIHNPEVGLAEGVVSETDLAFFLAGGFSGIGLIEEGLKAGFTIEQAISAAYAELRDQHLT